MEALNSWPLVNIEAPGKNDVVCGRGGLANRHNGNHRFRKMVFAAKYDYANSVGMPEKTALAERLTRQWRESQTPPGRFLKKNQGTGLWYDVGAEAARLLCKQILRNVLLQTTPSKEEEDDCVPSPPIFVSHPAPPPIASPMSESGSNDTRTMECQSITAPSTGSLQQNDDDVLLKKSLEVMASEKFRMLARNFDRRGVIQMANSLGGPRMKLVESVAIEQLGRIPRSSEGYAEDALKLIGGNATAMQTEVFFFSHRWLCPNQEDPSQSRPDSEDNIKAKALIEFFQWRRQWVRINHCFRPNILLWIDYCCHDQDNLGLGFSLLPMWTACCERFLRFETPTYHSRVWCRLEPMLSAKFSYADHHVVIRAGFTNKWPDTGKPSTAVLLDPREGHLTDPKDAEKLHPLVSLAVDSNAGVMPIIPGQTPMKTFEL